MTDPRSTLDWLAIGDVMVAIATPGTLLAATRCSNT